MNNKSSLLFGTSLEDPSGDFYYTLCNVAGTMLQGQTVNFFGQTFSGDEARHAGIELVKLVDEFNKMMKARQLILKGNIL